MSQRFLQAGETLRIRAGARLLLLHADSAWEVRIVKRGAAVRIARTLLAWWLRLRRVGAAAGRRFLRARREEAQARLLAQLDARTLKDIGLEPHRGAFAERVAALRYCELLRI